MRLYINLCIIAVLTYCGVAFAQDVAVLAPEVAVTPDLPWLAAALAAIKSLPVVGPYVKVALEVISAINIACLAAILFMKTILSISHVAALKFSPKLAKSIADFEAKVMPWLKYFSQMNVQKEELKNAGVPKVMI